MTAHKKTLIGAGHLHFGARTRALLAGIVAFNTIAPFSVWLQTSGNPLLYLQYTLPAGQEWYILSKLCGLYAVAFLSTQIVFALLKGGKGNPVTTRAISLFPVHKYLGVMIVSVILLHAGLFVTAVSLRSGHLTTHMLVPDFFSGHYNLGISVGVLGLWLVSMVAVSGYLRISGKKAGKFLHRLALPGYLLALLHSLMIGTETGYLSVKLFYGAAILAILLAMIKRIQGPLSLRNQ